MTDKEKIKAKIERLFEKAGESLGEYRNGAEHTLITLNDFIDSLPEESVSDDLEEAMKQPAEETRLVKAKNGHPFFSEEDFKLGFSNGAQWKKEQMMAKAVKREVKQDAGGYPYIDATELYDYDKDIPLAKAGDKVKVIILKDS